MPRRAGANLGRRGGASIPFVSANAIDREGRKLGGVFLVFSVNQEAGDADEREKERG